MVAAATGGTAPAVGVEGAAAAGTTVGPEAAAPSDPGPGTPVLALSPGPLVGTAGSCEAPSPGVACADTALDGVFRSMFFTVIINRNGSMWGVDCRMLSISATWNITP